MRDALPDPVLATGDVGTSFGTVADDVRRFRRPAGGAFRARIQDPVHVVEPLHAVAAADRLVETAAIGVRRNLFVPEANNAIDRRFA